LDWDQSGVPQRLESTMACHPAEQDPSQDLLRWYRSGIGVLARRAPALAQCLEVVVPMGDQQHLVTGLRLGGLLKQHEGVVAVQPDDPAAFRQLKRINGNRVFVFDGAVGYDAVFHSRLAADALELRIVRPRHDALEAQRPPKPDGRDNRLISLLKTEQHVGVLRLSVAEDIGVGAVAMDETSFQWIGEFIDARLIAFDDHHPMLGLDQRGGDWESP
jgi:hypothetical protein